MSADVMLDPSSESHSMGAPGLMTMIGFQLGV